MPRGRSELNFECADPVELWEPRRLALVQGASDTWYPVSNGVHKCIWPIHENESMRSSFAFRSLASWLTTRFFFRFLGTPPLSYATLERLFACAFRQMCVFWLMWPRSICFVPFVAEPKGWCEKYRRCFLVRQATKGLLESETVFLPAITLMARWRRVAKAVECCEVLLVLANGKSRGNARRRHFPIHNCAPLSKLVILACKCARSLIWKQIRLLIFKKSHEIVFVASCDVKWGVGFVLLWWNLWPAKLESS